VAASPALIERIRSEYLALPALKLTPAQAHRLWPASDEAFGAAMDSLVAEGFLRCLPSGSYVAVPRSRRTVAKADIELRSAASSMRCPHCHKLNTMSREPIFRRPLSATVRCVACGRIVTVSAISA
jgi:ribosomal protein S27E